MLRAASDGSGSTSLLTMSAHPQRIGALSRNQLPCRLSLLTARQQRPRLAAMAKVTTNQLVGYNLRKARERAGLTQDEAAEALAPYLGVTWSRATFSAAERSVTGSRVRQFTADEVAAFARGFGLPVAWFFLPPEPDDGLSIDDSDVESALLGVAGSRPDTQARSPLAERVFRLSAAHRRSARVRKAIGAVLGAGVPGLRPGWSERERLLEVESSLESAALVLREMREAEEERWAAQAE